MTGARGPRPWTSWCWLAFLGLPGLLLYFHYIPDVAGATLRARAFTFATTLTGFAGLFGLAGRLGGRRGVAWAYALLAPLLLVMAGHGLAFQAVPRLASLLFNSGEVKDAHVLRAMVPFVPWAMAGLLAAGAGALAAAGPALRFRAWVGPVLLGAWCCLTALAAWLNPFGRNYLFEGVNVNVRNYGLLATIGYDTLRTWRGGDAQAAARLEEDAGRRPIPRLASAERARHVVILQVESLDWNVLDWKVGARWVVPFLHGLAAEVGPIPAFPNYSSVSGSSGSDFQVLSGYRPVLDLPAYRAAGVDYSRALPRLLAAKGAVLDLFHGNRASFWSREEAVGSMGIHAFHALKDIPCTESTRWGATDRDLFRYVSRWADAQTGPFAAMAITLSSHSPFNLVDSHVFPGSGDVVNYFNVIRYTDTALEEFITGWRVPDTVFVLYGDHPAHVAGDGYRSCPTARDVVPLLVFRKEGEGFRRVALVQQGEGQIELASVHSLVAGLF